MGKLKRATAAERLCFDRLSCVKVYDEERFKKKYI